MILMAADNASVVWKTYVNKNSEPSPEVSVNVL